MSLKSTMQRVVFNQALKKRTQQNKGKSTPFNLNKAKSFAFLLNLSEEKAIAIEKVMAFAEKLRKKGKEVTLLGYTDALEAPTNLGFDCFCKKDLNWALVPKGPVVDAFLAKEYDVLINFYLYDCQALDFMTSAVGANFRVGYYIEERTEYYDLMVHNRNKDFDAMIRQIEYGMGIVNAK